MLNDAPRDWVAEFSLEGCQRPALYKYQVAGEQKDRPELRINPLLAATITAGKAAFSDRLLPMSVTLFSTWNLKQAAPGIIADPEK